MTTAEHPWPRYFQPDRATVADPAGRARLPTCVLDIFWLRPAETAATELIVVVGCRDGRLDVARGGAIDALPDPLCTAVRAAEINGRGKFRTLHTRDLSLFALQTSEQTITARGLNDAVALRGTMQARLTATGGDVRATMHDIAGRLLVGRLDLLGAASRSLAAPFQGAALADERVYHLLVPLAPLAEIERGEGLALLYPYLDTTAIAFADNSFMLMRLVHSLLYRLREDLRAERSAHPFARATIPVPDRAQLEQELRDEGYAIEGNLATRRADNSTDAETFLARLRRFIDDGGAQRLALPPQAQPDDYRRAIDALLPTLASPDDRAMLHALAERDGAHRPIPPPPPPAVAPPVARHAAPSLPPQRAERQIHPPRAIPPSGRAGRRNDWAADFAGGVAQRPVGDTATDRDDWGADFGESAPARSAESPRPAPSARGGVPAAEAPGEAKSADWATDFDPPSRDETR